MKFEPHIEENIRTGEEKVTAGQEFVKKIRPVGCVMFLLMGAVVVVFCLFAGRDPIPDYEAKHEAAYYVQSAQTMEELKAELEENVFPNVEGVLGSEISGDKLVITIEDKSFAVTRGAILRYYDISLFEFERG